MHDLQSEAILTYLKFTNTIELVLLRTRVPRARRYVIVDAQLATQPSQPPHVLEDVVPNSTSQLRVISVLRSRLVVSLTATGSAKHRTVVVSFRKARAH